MTDFKVKIRRLGLCDYAQTWEAMKDFTARRTPQTQDEIWLLQHHPVLTQGLAGRAEHILQSSAIPIVQSDRGGQVTYHAPGQMIVYLLLDVRRFSWSVRELVRIMEASVVNFLSTFNIAAHGDIAAPGVYVGASKIASLGLRIRNHATYHGLALNVDMDLSPFSLINPCGYAGLTVTQLRDLGVNLTMEQCQTLFLPHLLSQLQLQAEDA